MLKNNQYDEIIKIIEGFEYDEVGLRGFFFEHDVDHGMFILSLITDIAYSRNLAFWFKNISFFFSFSYHYIDGAQRSALFYLIKAYKLNKDNVEILEIILDFQLPPEIVLSKEEAIYYARQLLSIDSSNEKALSIIHNSL